ncbi:hypothetical protein [Raineya sp.]|jgi:hypothetical protein
MISAILLRKNLIVPFIILAFGLMSAFVIAPETAQKSISQEYDTFLKDTYLNFTKKCEKVFNIVQESSIQDLKKDLQIIEKEIERALIIKDKAIQTGKWQDLAYAYDNLKRLQSRISTFSLNHKGIFYIFETLEKNWAKWKKLISDSQAKISTLQSQTNQYSGREKEYLLSAWKFYEENEQKLGQNLSFIEKINQGLPLSEKISLYNLNAINTNTEFLINQHNAETERLERWLKDFAQIETATTNRVLSYGKSIQEIKKRVDSISTADKIFNRHTALRKTDSLLTIAQNTYNKAYPYFTSRDFLSAYITLDNLIAIEPALQNEFATQVEQYETFKSQYDDINKELAEIKKNGSTNKDYQDALASHNLALQYAMMANWAMAQNHLQKSSQFSEKAYSYTFKRSSPRRDYYSGGSSGSDYSKSSGGSSYSSKRSSSSSSSNSYSSSKKSDSRSWSSSSSRKSSSSSSSSNSSRRSDSRSWGSRSGGRRR